MGWEERNGSRYYYRKKRSGGRTVTEYLGNSPEAFAAADKAAGRAAAAALKALDAQTDAACRRLAEGAAAALTEAGYHRHKREWRRRRMTATQTDLARATAAAPEQRARLGDTSDGDLSRIALEYLCRAQACDDDGRCNHARWAAAVAAAEKVRDALEGANPTMIEHLLCTQTAINWVVVNWLAVALVAPGSGRERNDRWFQRAHGRYVSSLKALNSVRRLPGLTAVQVNIGGRADRPGAGPFGAAETTVSNDSKGGGP